MNLAGFDCNRDRYVGITGQKAKKKAALAALIRERKT